MTLPPIIFNILKAVVTVLLALFIMAVGIFSLSISGCVHNDLKIINGAPDFTGAVKDNDTITEKSGVKSDVKIGDKMGKTENNQ